MIYRYEWNWAKKVKKKKKQLLEDNCLMTHSLENIIQTVKYKYQYTITKIE